MKNLMIVLGLGLCFLIAIFAEAFIYIQVWTLILKQHQPWVYIWGMLFVCVIAGFNKLKVTLDL